MCNNLITCRVCKEDKPAEEYSKSKTHKSGRQSLCKICFNEKYNKGRKQKAYANKHIQGSTKVEDFNREQLLKQVSFIMQRQATNKAVTLDYSYFNKFK